MKTFEEKRESLNPMDNSFMKFFEDEYNVTFVDAEVYGDDELAEDEEEKS